MKKCRISSLILLLLGVGFGWIPTSYSQDVIELLKGADKITLDGKTGNYILVGNVVFKKENTKLYCDSAYYNYFNNTIRAYGRVHLNKQDSLNMFCDSTHYNLNTKLAQLYGNVRIRNNAYKLTTDSIEYNLDKDIGIYRNYGVITNIVSDEKLTSIIGYFYPNIDQFNFSQDVVYTNEEYTITTDTLQFNSRSKKAFFFGPTFIRGDSSIIFCERGWYNIDKNEGQLNQNAYIKRPDIYIKGDSLYYSSIDSIYIGKNNVEIIDTTNNIAFLGDYALSSEKESYSFITGHVLAKRFNENDTLYIHADTLYSYLDSMQEPSLLLAYNNVEIFKPDMQGICDSLVYLRDTGTMNMLGNPILWAKNAQLTADTISVYEKENEIQRAFLRKNGLVVTTVKGTNYYNQVAGTVMNAYFDSTQIKSVDIEGNAKTIYFLEEESKNDSTIILERKGMNRLYASDITLRFRDGDITTATYRNKPDGVLYPMNDINQKEKEVPIFQWNPKQRPKSWQQLYYNEDEEKLIQHFILWYWKLQHNLFTFLP